MHGVLFALPTALHSYFCPPSVAPFPATEPEGISGSPMPLVGDHVDLLETYTKHSAAQRGQPCFRLLVAKLPPETTSLQLTEPLEQVFPCSVSRVSIPLSKHGKRSRNFAIIDLRYRIDPSKAQEAYRKANLSVEMKAVDIKEFV